jgi:hypothetical protein
MVDTIVWACGPSGGGGGSKGCIGGGGWGGEGIIHHLECRGCALILAGKGLNRCDARDAPATQIHGCRWCGYWFGALGEVSNGGCGGGGVKLEKE